MGMLDLITARATPSAPVEIPEFVPSDKSALTDRELAEAILTKMEQTEHTLRSFMAQMSASPLLSQFVPKL